MHSSPALFTPWKRHRHSGILVLPERDVQCQRLSDVHSVVVWHKAYDGIGADVSEGPGFVLGKCGEGVDLGVVEDVVPERRRDTWVRFADGEGTGHGGSVLKTVPFTASWETEELKGGTDGFDNEDGVYDEVDVFLPSGFGVFGTPASVNVCCLDVSRWSCLL